MPIKKAVKKIVESLTEPEAPKFNEFGVCIDCQGGDPNCLHNNLVENGQSINCVLCGFKVK